MNRIVLGLYAACDWNMVLNWAQTLRSASLRLLPQCCWLALLLRVDRSSGRVMVGDKMATISTNPTADLLGENLSFTRLSTEPNRNWITTTASTLQRRLRSYNGAGDPNQCHRWNKQTSETACVALVFFYIECQASVQ